MPLLSKALAELGLAQLKLVLKIAKKIVDDELMDRLIHQVLEVTCRHLKMSNTEVLHLPLVFVYSTSTFDIPLVKVYHLICI